MTKKAGEVSPEILKAMQDALCDFRLGEPLTEAPALDSLTKPLTFVRDKNGVWAIKKTPFGVGVVKASEIPGAAAVMAEAFLPSVPKLPWALYASIVTWFRAVHHKHKAEAYVQVWYRKDGTAPVPAEHLSVGVEGGEYYIHVPTQDISGGGVDHEGRHDKDGELGHLHVFDIHSHHTMGAFWSGTDDGDEKKHERLFGVIGTIDKTIPSSKWRTCLSGKFIDLSMEAVVEIPEGDYPFVINFRQLLKGGGTVDLSRLEVNPFEGATYPEGWDRSLITEKRGGRFFGRLLSSGGKDPDAEAIALIVVDKGNVERLLKIRGGDLFEVIEENGRYTERHVKSLRP